ncbi:MAG: UDP-N-acetylglucosamine--N-acetylmuramyl-(pentapeptide) pyrophosphoryl-undecaprenol N-acetylglucosamine transferase [bacterium]|nr:UDP-N-acetylglucosamine--N-acetylmuramyl-(pentapeptide) pyrophosphoryl-undecaprenol N-acetylglucosamine transferase [bacterium]
MVQRTILFVGGGSIGHIAPSIAVCEELQDAAVHFVCGPKPSEAKYILEEGYECSTLHAPRISLSFPWKFWKACKQSKEILNRVKPDIIFSKGGYVSVPLCYVAHKKSISIVLHESDAVSGYANRLVSRWAKTICHGFRTKDQGLKDQGHIVVTGNPIRKSITQGSKEKGLSITGLRDGKPILLVIGGSQGSLTLNKAINENADALLEVCNIIHITGKGKRGITRNPQPATRNYFTIPFAHAELQHFYAAADLALSRAGASALAELAANSIPTIVVPLRGVGHDHQKKNAEAAAESGGCIELDEDTLCNTIVDTVKSITENPDRRITMSRAISSLSRSDSARQIAKILS